MTSTDLAIPEEMSQLAQSPANLFGTSDPAAVVEQSSKIASALADVIRSKNLSKQIGKKEHILVEGWTLLGTMLGVFPVVEWTRPLLKDGQPHGWEARVEARTLGGQVVGAAEAECTRDESQWGWHPTGRNGQTLEPRDDYALRSMAQTRAVSKALRGPLGFIVTLAGYEATPADEMPSEAAPVSPVNTPEREEAVNQIAILFEELKHHTLPEGWTSWNDFAFAYIEGQFQAKDLSELDTEQLRKTAEYLGGFTVPV